MKCKCGKELTTNDYAGMCPECLNSQNKEKHNEMKTWYTGWECPKCGYVWAVWVNGCLRCNQLQFETVTLDTGGNNNG